MSSTSAGVERDEDSGRFTSDTREKVFEAVPDNGEPVRASDVAEKVGKPRTTVNRQLNKLHEEGRIQKKKFHERRVVYWKDDPSGLDADERE